MKIYRFRNCLLNTAERLVLLNGKFIEISPKTFDVLQLLVENCGEIVTKDEILGKVWDGSFVEEGNLAVHISKLRRTLDENKNQPLIETIPGTGYRFIAPVQIAAKNDWEKLASASLPFPQDNVSREWKFDSIAVLPLANESKDEEIEYLADGLTESFINSLARFAGLKVIARNTVFRYKNKDFDAREVGETLGVAAILTGRIKILKDNLIISVELINVADDTQIWGTQFNQPFSDIIKIQEEIASTVTGKLQSEIHQVIRNTYPKPITSNAESYRLYLKGKYFLEKRTDENIFKAFECLQKSVSFDPTNVYSYVEMVEGYRLLYCFDYILYQEYSKKVEAILSAIKELDQSVDVVQTMYGSKMILEWKFKEAEKHLQNALKLNPYCLTAHYRYADLLIITGRFSEALKELNQIVRIDPLSLVTYLFIARAFYRMGRPENAATYLNDALELEPNNYEALALLGAVLTELGNYSEATIIFQKSLNIHYNIGVFSMIAYTFALEGKKDKSLKIINQIKSNSNSRYPINLSLIYLALDRKEIAYEFLEKAYEQHDIDLNALKSDPRWKKIRNETRFKELVSKIGLPID